MIRIFRHYIPKSLFLLGLLEVIIIVLSLYWAQKIAPATTIPSQQGVSSFQFLVYAFVMLSIMTAMGLYQRDIKDSLANLVMRVGASVLCAFAAMALLFYLEPDITLSINALLTAASIALLGLLASRYSFFHYADKDFLKRRAIVLGAGKRATRIEAILAGGRLDAINILGFVPVGGEVVAVAENKVIGCSATLSQLAEELRVDEVIVAIDDRRVSYPTDQLLDIKMSGIEVVEDIAFWEKHTGKIEISSLNPSHLIFADGYVHAVVRPGSKRVFDVVISMLILLLSLPILLITALAIWIESGCKGNIFYKQHRVGAGGRLFRIVKLRSMKENAELNGAQWAVEDDPRVTRIGRFIRKTRIDELPQVLNVLKGTMSFVGPRPERPEFVEELQKKIPYYALRHGIKPGITGWAQINYPYGATDEDARNKLQYDLYYMKNYTVFLDVMIIFQTLQVILWQKGSR